MSKIGLVTVLFNSDNVLEGFFQSLSIQSFKDYHLYLIDNTPGRATDILIETLRSTYNSGTITHIKNDSNVGVAKGNNQGIELSIANGCTHTLILNNDIEFDQPSLLEDMYSAAITADEKLIIPKILYYGTDKIWMAGGTLKPYTAKVQHFGEDFHTNDSRFNKPAYFNYAPTCFMLVNNEVFKEVGLMDERYFVYYDDTDFIYRATAKKYKIYYMPQLVIFHKVSSSTGGSESPFSIYYSNRNRLYFIRKNLKGLKYLTAMAFTFTTRMVKLLKASGSERGNLYKAMADGLKMSYK